MIAAKMKVSEGFYFFRSGKESLSSTSGKPVLYCLGRETLRAQYLLIGEDLPWSGLRDGDAKKSVA